MTVIDQQQAPVASTGSAETVTSTGATREEVLESAARACPAVQGREGPRFVGDG
jgi:hypothetical protein